MAIFKLAFGIHNHQPVGNFDSVFEQAHTDAYAPFLKLLKGFDQVSLSLHQSGILWDWQKKHHPEYFELVCDLIRIGQVELMTGGFFEPVLTSIPERDALGQIEMLTQYLKENFGVKTEGLWLTERIWEPHLPKLLSKSNIRFLPIDDTHFIYAGLDPRQLRGPFITEEAGHTVTLLPIQKKLRYLIPFGTVEEIIEELKRQAGENPDGLAVYADDGEKFGVWPNTHKHCYTDGWLEKFFDAMHRNSDWLKMVPLSEAAAMEPAGRAYLPSASYEEMLHWSLPTNAFLEYGAFEYWLKENGRKERFGRFVRGGHWRGFLAKYEESNLMHKSMLAVSDKLEQVAQANPKKVKTQAFQQAREKLYASQCNCPYWHGIFGGLYLPHLRKANYSAMIEANALLRKMNGETGLQIQQVDYDCDGHDEILAETEDFSAVIKPNRGGSLIHLALNRHAFNLTDTLTRRREGYHAKLDKADETPSGTDTASIHDIVLSKEEGLSNFLAEDWYQKRCFIDHFFHGDVTLEKFGSSRFGEEGDFVNEPYTVSVNQDLGLVSLQRHGNLWRSAGVTPVSVSKNYSFNPDSDVIKVSYELCAPQSEGIDTIFVVENNFTFQAGHADDRYMLIDGKRPENSFLDSIGRYRECQSVTMADEYLGLGARLASDVPAEIWHTPIFTVSLSESGFERVYQGTTILALYSLRLSHRPIRFELSLQAGDLKKLLSNSIKLEAVESH